MRARLWVIVFAFLCIGATPKGMAPLPSQYIKGHVFHSPDGWFTVETPAGDWEWFEMRQFDGDADPRWPDGAHPHVAWYIRNAASGEHFTLMETYDVLDGTIDQTFIAGIEIGTKRGLDKGETLTNFAIGPIRVPTDDSIRYAYKITRKTGSVYRFAYVSGAQHKVYLQTTSDSPVETKTYKRFVVSFRWVKQP
ncbi:MAG TPA: hypothetical protein VMU84_14300 [Thermoanaerobaculia bacterium]|nr:hypothetical protein [Thermoanaerobaculia bacterium]